MAEFTPMQVKILAVLSDGLPHKLPELMACLDDLTEQPNSLHRHLSVMRRKLRPRGEDIICQFVFRQRQYRHVRLLHSSSDGQR